MTLKIDFFKKLLKYWLPLFIVVSGMAVYVLLKATRPTSETAAVKERSWHVQTLTTKLQALSPSLTLYGQIETPALVNAAAPRKSRVLKALISEGDRIKQGQLLLLLDERDFKPHLIQAQAKAEELKALIQSEQLRYQSDKVAIKHEQSILNLQESAVKRAKRLKNKNLGSTATLEQAQESYNRQYLTFGSRKLALDDHAARQQQLQARLADAEADVELAKLDLERSRIIAPFDGLVEKLSVAVGDQVNDNQILLTIYPDDKLQLRAKIPTTFQHEIQQALKSGQILAANANYAGTVLKLKLDQFSGKADARGIDALFSIQSGGEWLRPGASLVITLHRPLQKNALALPYSAIYDNNRIFRVHNQRLQAIPVKILGNFKQAEKNQLLVFSPELKENDPIVITQLPGAISGLKVEILSNTPKKL